MSVTINADQFCERTSKVYAQWQSEPELFSNATALSVPNGAAPAEQIRYLKSVSLQLWLFGYELPETVMVLCKSTFYIITSTKKANILTPLIEPCSAKCGITLAILPKDKGEDGATQMHTVLDAIRATGADAKLGLLPKEKHEGKIYALWTSLQPADVQQVDIATGISEVLAVKSPAEVLLTKKAAFLASSVLKDYMLPKIEGYLEGDKVVKHSHLSDLAEKAIDEPTKIGVKLKANNTDVAYLPVFQSGGNYDLKVSAQSDDARLHPGVVICSLGTKYGSYCANITRTLLLNPSPAQQEAYAAVHAALKAGLAVMRAGVRMSAVYEAVVAALGEKGKEDLVPRLTKTVGNGIGLELRDSQMNLSGKNERLMKAGMVFNVSVGVSGLTNPEAADERGKQYALQVADTVVVRADAPVEHCTASCASDLTSITYNWEEADDGEEVDARRDGGAGGGDAGVLRQSYLRGAAVDGADEAERQKQQRELVEAKNQETLNRLTQQQNALVNPATHSGQRQVANIVSYRDVTDLPPRNDLVLSVDNKSETVLCPIYGLLVPFHILTIKSIAAQGEDDRTFRINIKLNTGGVYDPAEKYPHKTFIKELSYRSSVQKHAVGIVQQVQMLRKQVMQRDKASAEVATLVRQEKLKFAKRVYRLSEVWVRPTFGGKGRKLPGTLEAHTNGFRYTSAKNEPLDIMFANIRHAFFQPCENEMVTVIHFNLTDSIMVGKKKVKDVQFYRETMDAVNTLDGGGRRGGYDPDEVEEEQRERERRNRVNSEFQQFTKRVKELWDRDFSRLNLDFEVPFRELAFSGVPHRTATLLMPTTSCIVELVEQPPTVIAMDDIEIMSLERVGFGLKNFDMAIVWKDFSREVMRIDAIPTQSLDDVKQWLSDAGIKYYESKMNLSWKPILKSIISAPHDFVAQGGWNFLDADMSDSDGEGSEEEPDFRPSDEDGDASSDAMSEDESVVESDDAGSDAGVDSDEEKGLSWDELEAQAKRDDQEREDGGDERGRKRKHGSGGGGSNKRR